MPTLQLVIDARKAAEGAAQFHAATGQVRQSAGQAAVAVEGLDKQFHGLGPTTQSVVGYLKGLVATYGTLLSVQHVYQVISGFENALDRVGKMTGLTGPALERLGDRFVELSAKIPVPAKELANLGATAAQLGVRGSEEILKFTETAARLSDALGVGAEGAVTALVRVSQATGEGYGNVEKLGAVMGRLGMSTGAAGEQILGMAEGIAKSASLYKLSSADVLGLSAAFASAGAGAEQGAMTVNKLLGEMDKAVREGGGKLELLGKLTGQSGQQFAAAFGANAADALQQFVAGLGQVIAAGGDTAAVLEAMGLEGDRIGKALPTLASNTDLLSKSLALARQEAKTGTALEDDFGKLDDQLALLQNTVDAVILRFRNAKGPVADFLGVLRQAIALVGGLEPVTRDTSAAAVLLAESFKVAGVVLAGVVAIKAGTFFVGLTQDVIAAAKAIGSLAAACWPLAAAVAAIGTAVAAFEIGRYLYDEFAAVRHAAQDLIEFAQRGVETVRHAFVMGTTGMGEMWNTLFKDMERAFAAWVRLVADGLASLGQDDKAQRLRQWIGELDAAMQEPFKVRDVGRWVGQLQELGQRGGAAMGAELTAALQKAMAMGSTVVADYTAMSRSGPVSVELVEKMTTGVKYANAQLLQAIEKRLQTEQDASQRAILELYKTRALALREALSPSAGGIEQQLRQQHEANLAMIKQASKLVHEDIDQQLPSGRKGQSFLEFIGQDLDAMKAKLSDSLKDWAGLGAAAQAAGQTASQGLQQAEAGAGQLQQGLKLTADQIKQLGEAAKAASRVSAEELDKRNADIEQMIRDAQTAQEYLKLPPEKREIRMGIDQMQLRMVDDYGHKIEGVTDRTQELNRELQKLEDMKKLEATAQGIGDAFGNAFESIIVDAKSVSEALQNLAKDIQRVLVRQLVTQPIASAITSSITSTLAPMVGGGGGSTGNLGGSTGKAADFAGEMARGGVIDAGEILPFRRGAVLNHDGGFLDVVPFGKGGVVSRPTYFPLHRQRLGLMGEAGPEAILPLQRLADGALGVRASVQAFAAGGVLPQSAFFPLSGGRLGLAGEEGPEAILPLKRGADGKLGVAAQGEGGGRGGTTVVQHITINTPDADSFRKSKHQIAAELQQAGIRAMRRG